MLTVWRRRDASSSMATRAAVGIAGALAYLVTLAWAMGHASYDIWGAMIVGPLLVAVSIPILDHVVRAERDRWMGRVIVAAFVAKLLGTLVRYAVTFELYGDRADATGYHGSGARLAAAFWNGTWAEVLRAEVPELVGTEFIRLTTGLVYIATGPTKLGGFLVYSWLGFWGLLLCYRAFRLAVPSGDHRRYALLVFFLPSLLFWPSSIGKEAWVLFTLGLVAFGSARVLTHRTDGYLVVALGLVGTAAVRPHITLLGFAALFAGVLLRRRSWREARLGLLGRLAGLAILITIGAVVIDRTAEFFNIDALDQAGVEQVLDRTEAQTAGRGSSFESPRLASPSEYPTALVSVLFRPFPWEAGNAQALAAALEGTVVLALVVASWRRLGALPRTITRVPYVAFATAYTAIFVAAFSAIGNFGLLARQRTQVLPFLLVLLALPTVARQGGQPAGETAYRSSPRKERPRSAPRVSRISEAWAATSSRGSSGWATSSTTRSAAASSSTEQSTTGTGSDAGPTRGRWGSTARTSAPRATRRSTTASDGDSRQSDVPAL